MRASQIIDKKKKCHYNVSLEGSIETILVVPVGQYIFAYELR